MKVVLAYVASLNGKITKGDDPDVGKWNSPEDKVHFKKLQDEADVIIRSSTTYEIAKERLHLSGEVKHVILTREPQKYEMEAKNGVLEFTAETPKELINRMESEGKKNVLLSIGGKLVAEFFKADVITEFYLTLEPKVFGSGVNMVAESDFEANYKLESSEKLNENGTLLLKYVKIRQ